MANRRRRSTPARREVVRVEQECEPDKQAQDTDTNEGEGEMAPQEAKQIDPQKERLFALNRCRYKSAGKIVVAEAGDEIIDPAPKDLEDLIEHCAVESFEPGQVNALLSLKTKDDAAKKRLAKMLGVI